MRRFTLLSMTMLAVALGLMLSSGAFAGENCCKAGSASTCAPAACKGATASAKCGDAQQQASCSRAGMSTSVRSHSDHRQAVAQQAAAVSCSGQKCVGKACTPCKPGEMCNGKPCKPGECKGSDGKCTHDAKGGI